jgi:hypothetical protein
VSAWVEIATAFFVYIFVGWMFVLAYLALQWFLQTTDVALDYSWTREGNLCRPEMKLVNRSRSKTYILTKISYRNRAEGLIWFDAKSLMGQVIEPRSAHEFHEIAPVRSCSTIPECMEMQVRVKLQNGADVLAINDQAGPVGMGLIEKAAFHLRAFLEG